ncbi:MAG: hypothetical protein V7K21_26970 [Nostoc sp.]|uniref:hypothetical protein n=1 Tax=Nostoc sp. TaxID=1180 RepID=UPI002FF84F55
MCSGILRQALASGNVRRGDAVRVPWASLATRLLFANGIATFRDAVRVRLERVCIRLGSSRERLGVSLMSD